MTLALLFAGCGGDDINEDARAELAQYLADNGIEAQQTQSGLYYVINEQGSDTVATASSDVTAIYEGRLLDGTVFDQSEEGSPVTFNLTAVIQGWTEGLQLVGVGGSITLYIPSDMAYGSDGRGTIPSDANLIFDVEITDVDGLRALAARNIKEQAEIEAFIAAQGIDPFITDEGVYIYIEEEGGEEKPTVESEVTIHYFGARIDGQQIDSSYDRGKPTDISLEDTIEGWQIAIPYFGRGGSGTIIIPSALAYGAERQVGIPPHTVLYFNIELIDF